MESYLGETPISDSCLGSGEILSLRLLLPRMASHNEGIGATG